LKEDATLRWLILKKVNRISLELLKEPFRKCCFKNGTNEIDFEDVSITPIQELVTQYTILTTFNRVPLEKS
jgi:hypothetical protein